MRMRVKLRMTARSEHADEVLPFARRVTGFHVDTPIYMPGLILAILGVW